MKIKAKFKGADGSLGYQNGANYDLHFTVKDGEIIITDLARPARGLCVYSTFRSFLNNWQVF